MDNLSLTLSLQIVPFAAAEAVIRAIRQAVFQVEQQVSADLDFDGLDETSTHLVAYWNGEPIGTARIRYLQPELAKIERVAVLSAYRGQGVGKALMQEAIAFLKSQNVPEVKLNAQIQAQRFYQSLGFEPQGDVFEDAGIPHIEMRQKL